MSFLKTSQYQQSQITKYRRLNWARYTAFEARNSRADLEKLCRKKSRSQLVDVFSTKDEAGLLPIHWAAINNRSDLIDCMLDNGSPLRSKCKNKLFADGSALHLASMNGSIEAASMLLRRASTNQTKPKRLEILREPVDEDKATTKVENKYDNKSNWLLERDAEGQTPLHRSAPPRSKRMDTVRELLRKNLWSLSGRPAEMALFLICKGADWRQTDGVHNMNLLHWAIVNDYDDIVHLLLVIDKELMNVPVKPIGKNAERPQTEQQNVSPASSAMESIRLDDSTPTSSASERSTSPLMLEKERIESIMKDGLLPLQIATVYSRISIISLLWNAQTIESISSPAAADDSLGSQKELSSKRSESRRDLQRIILKAFWSNKEELARFFRQTFLKFILALDFGLLAALWIPIYATTDGEGSFIYSVRGGGFIIAYCTSMVLCFRVILKNPGYLRRCSIQYLNEMRDLIRNDPYRQDDPGPESEGKPEKKLIRFEPLESEEKNRGEQDKQSSANSKPTDASASKSEVVLVDQRWRQKPDLEDRVRIMCHKCRCIRRPRSRHCNFCNHCVQDFDHHCIYLGCCIGRCNRLDFLLTLVVLTLASLYGTALHAFSEKAEWSFWHYISLMWIFKYAIIGCLNSFFILRRACLGVTMYEEIRARRIRKIFGPDGAPEEISKSHKSYSTLKESFWRYTPDRFLTGDLPVKTLLYNLKEFTNFTTITEYMLTVICPDTPLTRSLASEDSRLNTYKLL